MTIRFLITAALVFVLAIPVSTRAADTASSLIGEELQVFPGDKFYAEGETEDKQALELAKPFEGRMPGSMRIPFSFAIDTTRLYFARSGGDWDYYAAPQGKARAWHGLVGNVLAEGDTVGIRVHRNKGTREWFVDNTIHNRQQGWLFATIWNRAVKPGKDVDVHNGQTQQIMVAGSRMRGLEYLGVRDNQLRIRYEEFGDQERREEFLFPISGEEPLLIGVMGLRAEIRDINGASARIKILRGFQGDGFAAPTR